VFFVTFLFYSGYCLHILWINLYITITRHPLTGPSSISVVGCCSNAVKVRPIPLPHVSSEQMWRVCLFRIYYMAYCNALVVSSAKLRCCVIIIIIIIIIITCLNSFLTVKLSLDRTMAWSRFVILCIVCSGSSGSMNTNDLKISLRRGDSPLEGVSSAFRSATYSWSPVIRIKSNKR